MLFEEKVSDFFPREEKNPPNLIYDSLSLGSLETRLRPENLICCCCLTTIL